MTGQQAALDYARAMIERGMSIDDANVEVVRMMGVRIVRGKMDRATRSALMRAVKEGRLGHLGTDNLKPEAFFHPNSAWKAKEMRNTEAYESIQAISKVIQPRN